jgi:LPXTG-motif cell wall-anchored protein
MKGKYFAAAGLALIGAGIYFWLKRKKEPAQYQAQTENERHHLTNVFSRAKQVAVGN